MRALPMLMFAVTLTASCTKDTEPARYPDRPSGQCSRSPGETCAEGSLCHYTQEAVCGESGAKGACFPMPLTCTKDYNPVCGCDGRTYLNLCVAHSHGVSPRTSGPCPGTVAAGPATCGPGGAFAQCAAGSFCLYSEGQFCGEVNIAGQCAPQPTACTKEWAPVCGCDGQNYSNDCVAHSHGISIRHRGLCQGNTEATGEIGASCGTEKTRACATGLYCNFPVSTSCGAQNRPGKCRAKPQACTSDFKPVCGCDGQTYSNACSASAAGVSVRKQGSCEAP